jgi:hypothetical protein
MWTRALAGDVEEETGDAPEKVDGGTVKDLDFGRTTTRCARDL